ncbi:MAG TPA: tripartite tricarboxylate transporter permease [Hyphomicrobiaceae bacterium]
MEHAIEALAVLFDPLRLVALFAGMLAGMICGMLPGLGGVATASILLPFVFLLDDYSGLALLLGALSVVYTSDTITSVLVGAPGSPASAPTAIEGHALARQGKAAMALGVGFLASMAGGLIGAVTLAFAIPIAGPIVLALGTPELFMFAVVGLYFASSMIGRDLATGVLAGCIGILLGVVGAAPAAANYRFTFGQAYLLDGLSLTIVALGLFAVAEVIGMLASGGGIASGRQLLTDWGAGFTEFWRNRWLILRSSIIGVFGGFVPAVGASASTWVAYGHAVRSTPDKSRFGHGEIRGIAAAEGANNSTVISDLVPTLLFSVPGGPAAAIFLGALFSFGFYPGPRMVSEHPTLMYVIVWSVALASIIGAAICFAVTPFIARMTQIRFALIAAPLVLIMVAGAYQATQSLGDIAVLLILGLVGWLMKQADWPRAPVLVGFVLAAPMEQYFWLTTQIHGWSWLLRPGVLIIASFIVVPLFIQLTQHWRGGRAERIEESANPRSTTSAQHGTTFTRCVLASLAVPVFAYALWETMQFSPSSRLLPLLAIVPGLALAIFILGRELWRLKTHVEEFRFDATDEYGVILGFVVYGIGIALLGFNIATIGFLGWVLFTCAKMRPITGFIYGVVLIIAINGIFHLMRVAPPDGLLMSSSLF